MPLGKQGRRIKVGKNIFRSSWECYVNKLMLYNDIRFLYEPKRFFFPKLKLSYLPDFYLPDYELHIEVKGVLTAKDVLQITALSKIAKVLYLGEHELSLITGKPASYISKIKGITKYIPNEQELKKFKQLVEGAANHGKN